MASPRKNLARFNITGSNIIEINEILENYAEQLKVPENVIKSMAVVMKACIDNPEASPKLNAADYKIYAQKWAEKYIKGYEKRPSKRTSGPMTTAHDPIQDSIIKSRLAHLDQEDIKKIKYAHRLLMSAENISGDLLEEFLSINLLKYGWHCCWGMTMNKIDFCNETGQLLQIKNSDNSENSSSKTVRDNTKIQHWCRRKSRTGATNWDDLKRKLGLQVHDNALSQEKFQEFVTHTVETNPNCLFVEIGNVWLPQQQLESSDSLKLNFE